VGTLLKAIPKNFRGGIVVVQHVGEEFVSGMALWLSEQSGRRVDVAREGDLPAAGRVLVAGATGHLTLKATGRLGYTPEPRDSAYRPSVDVFFLSVSKLWSGRVVGVLLTGMGKDGAIGLKALRDKGHHTIAQDESSSAVYGMPKAAAGLEAAVDILPLDQIAGRLWTLGGARRYPGERP
jgi:chemotaxis response regulator CheB